MTKESNQTGELKAEFFTGKWSDEITLGPRGEQLLTCSCGKKTVIYQPDGNLPFRAQNAGWKFNGMFWSCGEEGHHVIKVETASQFPLGEKIKLPWGEKHESLSMPITHQAKTLMEVLTPEQMEGFIASFKGWAEKGITMETGLKTADNAAGPFSPLGTPNTVFCSCERSTIIYQTEPNGPYQAMDHGWRLGPNSNWYCGREGHHYLRSEPLARRSPR